MSDPRIPLPSAATLPSALARLQRLVELESPSGDERRVLALAATIAQELRALAVEVTERRAPGWGVHLEGRLPGAEPQQSPLLLLGHMDTVFPAETLAARPFRVEQDRALGPGVFDMKAGIAVLLEVLAQLRATGAQPRRPLRILLTCDEEVGSGSSRALIEELAGGARAVLVLEPSLPGGAAKTARKGVGDYRLLATGRAAHAGVEPEKGISAITELAHQVLAVQALAAPALGTTVTVGMIGGGSAPNVVPAAAWAEVDVRFSTAAEAARLDSAIRSLAPAVAGATLEVTGGVNRPPMERTAATAALYQSAREAAASLGFELGEGSTGGGSDGNFTAALGVPTLDGLGPDGGGAHALHEHVLLADLPRRVALIARLLLTL